jgi:hypothetical protein
VGELRRNVGRTASNPLTLHNFDFRFELDSTGAHVFPALAPVVDEVRFAEAMSGERFVRVQL